MTVQELCERFREIPRTLAGEPVVATYARELDGLLRRARQPSNCSSGHDAANHLYLRLVGPLAIHGYGLSTREQVLAEIGDLLERHRADPQAFAASLVPEDATSDERPGPGCGGHASR